MLNKCQFIGNLGADPEVRSTNSGSQVASFRIAVSERWKDKRTGERKETTEWITVVCFNENLIRVIEQYLSKGSKVYVEGQFKTRKWQDREGHDRWSTEIVMSNFGGQLILLDKREGGGSDDRYSGYEQEGRYGGGAQDNRGNPREDFQGELDDEIPF